jgi:AraC-like DNA-binding protein
VGRLTASEAVRRECVPRDFCLHLVVGGRGAIRTSRQEWKVSRGDLFCFWPGVRMELIPDPKAPWERYWMNLVGEGATQHAHALGFDSRRLAVRVRRFARAKRMFIEALEIYRTQREGDAFRMLALLYNLVPVCAPELKTPHPGQSATANTLARAAFAIENFPHEHLTVSQLARSLRVGRTTLYRAFSSQLATSPSSYLAAFRLNRAKDLLRNSHEKISTIAHAAGFSDDKYFLRLFRKEVGMTPSQYRKQALVGFAGS